MVVGEKEKGSSHFQLFNSEPEQVGHRPRHQPEPAVDEYQVTAKFVFHKCPRQCGDCEESGVCETLLWSRLGCFMFVVQLMLAIRVMCQLAVAHI